MILSYAFYEDNYYGLWYNFWFDVVSYVEGLAFIALLIQHHLNFKDAGEV